MIRITLIYRDSEGAFFDFDYYVNNHVPMSRSLLAESGLISIEVEQCLRTLDGDQPDVLCVSHVDLESEEALTDALAKHGDEMMADFPNYTNITPEIFVCEILTTGA